MARGRGFIQRAQMRLQRARARQQAFNNRRGRAAGGLRQTAAPPLDSQAIRESAQLGNEAADTRATLNARFDRAQRELGFGVGADNPYSKAAENRETFEANKRGIVNTAGNQLYAGSTLNKQSAARSDFDKNQKALEDAYAEAQAAHNRGLARTDRDQQLGELAIREGAISRAASAPLERLPVGPGRGRGRGRAPIREARNVRRPLAARVMNARARAINARINNRGRGRI